MTEQLAHDYLNAVGAITKPQYREGIEQLLALVNEMGGGAPAAVSVSAGNLIMPDDTAFCVVSSESGAADDLDTITFQGGGAGRSGRPIILMPASGHTITLRDTSVSSATNEGIRLKNPGGGGTVPSVVLRNSKQCALLIYNLADRRHDELIRDPVFGAGGFPVVTKSAAFTATPGIFYMCTGTTYAITLSAAGAYSVSDEFEFYNSASGDLTLTPTSEKIGNQTTVVLGPKQSIRLKYTGVANYEFVSF